MSTALATGYVVSEALSKFSGDGVVVEVVGFDESIVRIKDFEQTHLMRRKAFGNLTAGGSTRFQGTLVQVVKKLAVRPEERKVVLFLTDGDLGINPHILIDTLEKENIEIRGVYIGSSQKEAEKLFSDAHIKHWGFASQYHEIPKAVLTALISDMF